MEKFDIEFFELEDGSEPAKEYIDSLDKKMQAKIFKVAELLEHNGPSLRMPYSEYLGEDIFQIRAKQGTNIARILYFFVIGKKVILTNGFTKKTQKTPKKEIELAKKYREEYKRRFGV